LLLYIVEVFAVFSDKEVQSLQLYGRKFEPAGFYSLNLSFVMLCLSSCFFEMVVMCRMWEFAVSLFMLHVWPNSLLLVAVYGLVEAASVAAFGVVIGELVDKCPRLKVVQIALGVQNGSIVVAAVATVVLLLHPGAVLGGFGAFVTLVILVNTFGACGALSGLAMDVVVERDWVVVIAEQAPGSLTRINSVMRRIDLSCKLLAPVAVGFLMSYASMLASAVLIAIWNVSSVGLEYGLLYIVYTAVPILQQKSPSRNIKLESPDAEELAINLEAKEIEMHSTAQEAQVQTEVGNLSTGAILVIPCFWMCTSSLLVLHFGTP
jgi:iron-regulated transporter 1